jgi:hypothetical protein
MMSDLNFSSDDARLILDQLGWHIEDRADGSWTAQDAVHHVSMEIQYEPISGFFRTLVANCHGNMIGQLYGPGILNAIRCAYCAAGVAHGLRNPQLAMT